MGRIRRQDVEIQRKRLAREQGTIRKDWGGRVPIALCYPNSYAVGMCNLGFQSVYSLFNSARDFVCERVFAEPVLIGSRIGGPRRLDRRRAVPHRVAPGSARRAAVGRVAATAERLLGRRVQPVVRARLLQHRRRVTSSRASRRWPPIAPRPTRSSSPVAQPSRATPSRWRRCSTRSSIGEVEPVMAGLQDVFLGGGSRCGADRKAGQTAGRVRARAVRDQLRRGRHDRRRRAAERRPGAARGAAERAQRERLPDDVGGAQSPTSSSATCSCSR